MQDRDGFEILLAFSLPIWPARECSREVPTWGTSVDRNLRAAKLHADTVDNGFRSAVAIDTEDSRFTVEMRFV